MTDAVDTLVRREVRACSSKIRFADGVEQSARLLEGCLEELASGWIAVSGLEYSHLYSLRVLKQVRKKAARHIRYNEAGALSVLAGQEPTMLVAFGGGRVADATRSLAARHGLRWLYAPTIIASDGMLSGTATTYDDGDLGTISTSPPTFVILDREVLSNAGIAPLQSAAGDLLSNRSAIYDWQPANPREHAAAQLSKEAARLIAERPSEFFREIDCLLAAVIEGNILSGAAMSLAGSSRPCSGSEHLVYHALRLGSDRTPPHGFCVAAAARFLLWVNSGLDGNTVAAMDFIGVPLTIPGFEGYDRSFHRMIFGHASQLRRERRLSIHQRDGEWLERQYRRFLGEYS